MEVGDQDWGILYEWDRLVMYNQDWGIIYDWDQHVMYERVWACIIRIGMSCMSWVSCLIGIQLSCMIRIGLSCMSGLGVSNLRVRIFQHWDWDVVSVMASISLRGQEVLASGLCHISLEFIQSA